MQTDADRVRTAIEAGREKLRRLLPRLDRGTVQAAIAGRDWQATEAGSVAALWALGAVAPQVLGQREVGDNPDWGVLTAVSETCHAAMERPIRTDAGKLSALLALDGEWARVAVLSAVGCVGLLRSYAHHGGLDAVAAMVEASAEGLRKPTALEKRYLHGKAG